MGFLDDMRRKQGATSTTTPVKSNPFKPATNSQEKKEEVKTAEPKKQLPILQKKEGIAAATGEKRSPFSPKVEQKQEAEQPAADTKPEVKEETKTDKSIVEEMKAEDEKSKAEVKETKEIKEEAPAESPIPTSSGKGKRQKGKEKSETKPKTDTDTMLQSIPTTSVDYATAMDGITSPFVDEEWEAYKTEIEADLNAINIEDDMNPATLKAVTSKLTKLRNKVWNNYQGTKTQYENMCSKEPEGMIERIKRINLGDASNDMQRKKAGIEACMNFIDRNNNLVNLYEILDETRLRYNFLKGVMDSIEFKRSILVTMNGALKIESSLGPTE